jgi:membrane protein implicated in regulation of membrane protease activity
MEPYIVWALIGLALVIVEVLSGFGFPAQSVVAAVIGAVGAYLVHAYRVRNRAEQMAPIDQGQPAQFESWVDRNALLARVRYRGASWEARVEGDGAVEAGAMLYVLNANGNTLTVSKTRPG